MAQILNMHTQTRPSDLFLLASSKHNADLSVLKKNMSTTYRTKKSNIHIACTAGRYTTSIGQQEMIRVDPGKVDIRRSQFPPNFKFGTATSAYQIEGAWNEGGKGRSICDEFFHKVADGKNGDVATNSYHRYKEDVQLMKKMGVNSYRFSISWSRILPDGTLKGGINKEGVMYYNNLINELIENGITPFVTLFHWDVPLALDEKYGGFLDRQIKDDFKDYCQLCFQEFGDRVKHWATLNEPWTFSTYGYGVGSEAPGRCSQTLGCKYGDSMTEPYTVSHNLLLAHATAVQLYRNHFQSIQGGQIGIVLNCAWFKPYNSDSVQDNYAKDRELEFVLGWYMEPLVNGEYPYIMRKMVGKRLPEFSADDSEMLKGSFDFLGLNYYTTNYVKNVSRETFTPLISAQDSYVETSVEKDKVPIGPSWDGSWVYTVPEGLRDLLNYTRSKYHDPKIYITENGTCQVDDLQHKLPIEKAISDDLRTEYMVLHLKQLLEAIKEGAKVEGYFVWSLLDNFEWKDGYTNRFGLYYVDYNNDLARIPKKSSHWYTKFLHS